MIQDKCLATTSRFCVCSKCIAMNKGNSIPSSSIPPLPAGWCGPWEAKGEDIVDKNGHIIAHVYDYGHRTPEFIVDLLNVTHPAPAKEGE